MGGMLSSITGTNNGFVAEGAPITKQDFAPGIAQSAGQFNQIFGNQGALAQQLQGLASGQGPNPAQTMLNQATNRNIQQNAGMVAGLKGLSPALAQRLIAQNSAQAGQQAAGQGALMGAQQQQGALGQLAGVYGQQQQGALGMNQNLQNAQASQNNAIAGIQSNLNNTNAATAAGNQQNRAGLVGGALGGLGSALGLAHGGEVPQHLAFGGGAMSAFGQSLMGGRGQNPYGGLQALGRGIHGLFGSKTQPGDVDESGGLLTQQAQEDEAGQSGLGMGLFQPEQAAVAPQDMGAPMGAMPFREGGKVPGKAQVKGDSLKNDTVPADLSPGEIVIPRHITMNPNAPALAAKFVELELARHQHEKMACGGMAKYAGGGQVPEALSTDAPDVAQMPSQFISSPEQAPESIGPKGLGSNLSMDDVRPYLGPGWQKQTDQMPTSSSSDQSLITPDQGPANTMPEAQSTPKSGGGGGIDKYLNAKSGLAQESTHLATQNLDQMNARLGTLDQERENIQKDIKTGQIDPEKLFGDMKTGQKIRTTLGLILGGLGSGLTHGPNMALELLNKHIDTDIEAQKANLNSKQNLLSMNLRQTGDVRAAAEMTRMMQKDLIADKLQEVETNSQDPMVRQRAQLMRNQLTLEKAKTSGQLQMWQQMQGQQPQNLSPADKIRRLSVMGILPKEDKQAADKELGSQQKIEKLRQDVEGAAKLLDSKFLAGKLTPGSRASAINTFGGILAKEAEGKFNLEESKNQMSALLPDIGDLDSTKAEKTMHRKQFFDSFNNYPVLQQYGIGGPNGASSQQGFSSKTFKASK